MSVFFSAPCFIKLNVTLRVLGGRSDGYHDLCSLFWRMRSPETLEANFDTDEDNLSVSGEEIQGENLVTRVITRIRECYGKDAFPRCEMRLNKIIPLGSGVGAGSGNAAAVVDLFRDVCGGSSDDILDLASAGADIPFLAGHHELALVRGRGEIIEDLGSGFNNKRIVLLFPRWRNDTGNAYRALDEMRGSGKFAVLSELEAENEAYSFLELLRTGHKVGWLPNDFLLCANHESEYKEAGALADDCGAAAWGLCGSGSAFFAVFDSGVKHIIGSIARAIRKKKNRFEWLRKIMVLE